MAHLPHASKQDEMRIAGERKIDKIAKRFGAPFRRDDSGADIAAQDLRDFDVDQVGSMQRLVGGKDEAIDTPCRGRLEENLKKRGSVNNNQRLFLSARTATAGAGRGRTG